ncbi:inner nuclear membrane protein Man1-like [Ptychodera flava]|uniref:inner nuclear membrane protein Man1-like n=1 Tax=Ptychodera flava TaxID=63121 RepID=UPI003969D105
MAARKRGRAAAAALADNKLNDEELKEELKKYGQTVGPITNTTRSIYMKKLNHLKVAEKKERQQKTVAAGRRKSGKFFSSDESESDSGKKTKPKSTRSTATVQNRKSKVTTGSGDGPSTSARPPKPIVVSTVNRRKHIVQDRFSDTDEDESGEDEVDTTNVGTNTSWNSSADTSMNRSYRRPPVAKSATPRTSTPIKWNRSRHSETFTLDNANTTQEQVVDKDISKAGNVPTASNSSASSSAVNHVDKYHDDNEDVLQHEFATQEDTTASLGSKYAHIVSVGLVVLAVGFFLTLGIVYLTVGNQDSTVIQDTHMLCSSQSTDDKAKCSSKSIEKQALKVVNALYDKLSMIAGEYRCSSKPDLSNNMSYASAKQLTSQTLSSQATEEASLDVNKVFSTALEQIMNNPDWGIRLYDSDGSAANSTDSVKWLQSIHPHMSMICRIKESFTDVFLKVLSVMAVILIIYGICVYVKYRWKQEENEQREVYEMVEKIIDVLKTHHDACKRDKDLQPFLAIPHVRDMLLPPADRRKLQRLWDKAVKFLESSESRVRVESQCISGEDFAVWRWIQVMHDEYPHRKQWQGQAFENLETAVKTLAYSPTPCLKIRNMFDPTLEHGDMWHVGIQDAILEKCCDNDGIVHIAVDKTSKEGCVYMKCNSPESAGKAFKALHGCWFDGKLVTVKYLRLDRYHQRFPAALNMNTPLPTGYGASVSPTLSTSSLSSHSMTTTSQSSSNTEPQHVRHRLYPSLEGFDNDQDAT